MFGFSNGNNPYRKRNTVDLSLYFELKYNSDLPIEEAIDLLKSTGIFSSVEPRYPAMPLYQPNDPNSDSTNSPSGGNFRQNQLVRHKLYQAWDVSKGDSSITIGILDTGIRFDHEDLQKISFNENDTINGIDDDGDMALDSLLLDNYRGWDVADWDNDPSFSTDPHGVQVAGCASGECDNNLGVCGTGFYCKYLPIKVSHDTTNSIISHGYTGVVYAAEQGVDIINLSWGNDGPGSWMQWQQDVIDYAAIDYDAVVVASAGNIQGQFYYYPASYEHVISVAAMKYNNQIAGITTYSYMVDVNAVGVNANTTLGTAPNAYGPSTGSSFAAPTVSGVAGLIKSHRPELNALQIGELIRVTGDQIDNLPANLVAFEQLGKRLHAYRALIDTTSPSVRIIDWRLEKMSGLTPTDGDSIILSVDFQNYLAGVDSLSVTISDIAGNFSSIVDSAYLGNLGTLDTASNNALPFVITVNPGTNYLDSLIVRFQFNGTNYTDYQYLYIPLWDGYVDTVTQKTNYIASTLSACSGIISGTGDTLDLVVELFNNLVPSSNISADISASSPGVSILKSTSGFDSVTELDTTDNSNDPFTLVLPPGYAHGDSLIFDLSITGDSYSETYAFVHIIDTTTIDTLGYSVVNAGNIFSNQSGIFNLSGDTIEMVSDLFNESCDIDSLHLELESLSPAATILDSTSNFLNFNRLNTRSNSTEPFRIILDGSINTNDTIYLQLTHSSSGWIGTDSILLIIDDANLSPIAGITSEPNEFNAIVLPNPFNDYFNISLNSTTSITSYYLYDELFRTVKRGSITAGTKSYQINTSDLPNACYILVLQQGEYIQHFKIVKIGQ